MAGAFSTWNIFMEWEEEQYSYEETGFSYHGSGDGEPLRRS